MGSPRTSPESKDRHLAFALVAAIALTASPTCAQSEARTRAAQLYDRGVAAYQALDYATAATSFAEANRLLPSPVALAQAVRAYNLAGDPQRAGTLALRLLQQDGVTAPLRAIAQEAIANARRACVRIEVTCASSCELTVNGVPADGTQLFAPIEEDVVVVAVLPDGVTEERTVRGHAGDVLLVSFTHAIAESATIESRSGAPGDPLDLERAAYAQGENPYRISKYRFFSRPRASFFAVLVPTLLGGAMVTWSAIDTRQSRDRARNANQAGDPTAMALAHQEHARDAKRTRWLGVEAGTFVFATALIAAFTDWTPHGNQRERPTTGSVSVDRTGASFVLQRRF